MLLRRIGDEESWVATVVHDGFLPRLAIVMARLVQHPVSRSDYQIGSSETANYVLAVLPNPIVCRWLDTMYGNPPADDVAMGDHDFGLPAVKAPIIELIEMK